jgi:hypothetical protein
MLAFIPIVLLMFKGEAIRKYMGVPHNVNVSELGPAAPDHTDLEEVEN